MPLFTEKKLRVLMVRTDQIHPQISGNKWYKLKYNLRAARQQGYSRVISFGGAYSNHIHALAWSAKSFGLDSIGIIRGESVVNPMLADAREWGMQLHFIDRASYRERHNPDWVATLRAKVGAGFLIPEGGSNALALRGVAELMAGVQNQIPELNVLLCACGTGGTLAGLLSAAKGHVRVEGYPVLKGAGFLYQDIEQLLFAAGAEAQCLWTLDLDAHYGGYGKINSAHKEAWLRLEQDHQIPLDPVYTSKMMRRFIEKVHQNAYPKGSTVALLHTGGLQGRRSVDVSA
ncbi:1-aminocyclopropane-1-carboxylate deaminase/D-cysteine desulfhydrase [Neptunomonas antarctica]|uniref:1-aminocyclopropane-1-carboxylate deaminase/D-cysteine desulfhydrase, PLP-dependent ACC family n=1 Tax=Neptunomonas antarctica TaxID=619304 RepID=A0A1N7KCR5_9GAMM|nr:pyridoxal-phosphate dependent enzyme [Neptunomonas antarctica]SIS59361.1 1-aminocyclopropane-1-carboxylate deaminase/D-cysteine desulfhydrase, PLP-dependent ACC family [Neptunomonas antarctica]